MLGAIIGDIVGSVYEFDNYKAKDFEPFIHPKAFITDDTVCTIAVADNAIGAGKVYVFSRSGGTWTESQILITSRSGYEMRVAMDGDTIVVGSRGAPSVNATGAAQVYVRSGAAWALQQTLLPSDGAANDAFGADVAISGASFAGLALAHVLSFGLVVVERGLAMRGMMLSYLASDVASSVAMLERLPATERAAWLPRLARPNYRFALHPGAGRPVVSQQAQAAGDLRTLQAQGIRAGRVDAGLLTLPVEEAEGAAALPLSAPALDALLLLPDRRPARADASS
mgnify:CR=1 FL=1